MNNRWEQNIGTQVSLALAIGVVIFVITSTARAEDGTAGEALFLDEFSTRVQQDLSELFAFRLVAAEAITLSSELVAVIER